MRAIVRAGGIAEFAEAPCPVTLVWGDRDRVLSVADYGLPLQALVPGAQMIVLPGAGHVPMFDAPDALTSVILNHTGAVVDQPHDEG